MKKVLLFLASFLIGIYLFLPYDVLYSRALETLTKGNRIHLEYELSDASALKVSFSNVSIGRGKEVFALDNVTLRVTPLAYIFKGAIGYITTNGARVQVLKKDGLLDLVFDIRNFHNKILGDGKDIFLSDRTR